MMFTRYARSVGVLSIAAFVLLGCASPAASTSQPAAVTASTATAPQATSAPPTAQSTQSQATASAATPAPQGAAVTPAPSAASSAQAITKLNLNSATAEQFRTIPGVGDRMVREFDEYRPYTSIQQFRREIGKYVSQEQVATYEQYVFVPVDPNSADAETLRQLPGVDASIAAQLIAGRPYASPGEFVTKLGQFVSADQVGSARTYLTAQ